MRVGHVATRTDHQGHHLLATHMLGTLRQQIEQRQQIGSDLAFQTGTAQVKVGDADDVFSAEPAPHQFRHRDVAARAVTPGLHADRFGIVEGSGDHLRQRVGILDRGSAVDQYLRPREQHRLACRHRCEQRLARIAPGKQPLAGKFPQLRVAGAQRAVETGGIRPYRTIIFRHSRILQNMQPSRESMP